MNYKNLMVFNLMMINHLLYTTDKSINLSKSDQNKETNLSFLKKSNCNLNDVRLIDKDLSNLNLTNLKAKNALLLGVNLTNSDLSGAKLNGADFSGSILIRTKFKNAKLKDVQNLHQAIYKKCSNFPLSWLPWWEYDKSTLDLKQIIDLLVAGYIVCQKSYTAQEITQINKFK